MVILAEIFKIKARVYWIDQDDYDHTDYYLPFNPDINEWQYVMYKLDLNTHYIKKIEFEVVYQGVG